MLIFSADDGTITNQVLNEIFMRRRITLCNLSNMKLNKFKKEGELAAHEYLRMDAILLIAGFYGVCFIIFGGVFHKDVFLREGRLKFKDETIQMSGKGYKNQFFSWHVP